MTFREKFNQIFLSSVEDENNYSQEFFQSNSWNDPLIQSFLEEYSQSRSIPFIIRLIEQGKKENCVNKDISSEAIVLYISTYRNMLARSNISKKVRLDLGALFFYGLQGNPATERN